jgi:predicted ester cyclase
VDQVDNKESYRRYQAALRRPDSLAAVLAPDFVAHDMPPGIGAEEFVKYRRAVMASFPDQTGEILDIVAEGDRVAARSRTDQTHNGAFRGIAATGKRISFEVYEIVRVRGGKIAARWVALKPTMDEIAADLARSSSPAGG